MFYGCHQKNEANTSRFPEINHPEDNLPTQERIDLGERMFFSTIFSVDSTISCASCHMPEYAFADTLPVSFGVKKRLGTRNSPSLLNVGYREKFLLDGILPSLEKQVTVPIHEHLEMDFNIVLLSERMNKDSSWIKMSQKAYERNPDPYVITRALSVFQRTLVSKNSSYDKYMRGDKEALTSQQEEGMKLFNGKANCSECHSGLFFTNEEITNNGLYEHYKDSGKMRLTMLEQDRDLFKVPSLRNVEVTAPYMHNGSLSTLQEVISHYNSGGKKHINKSEKIKPLNLTEDEQQALISFLQALTDKETIDAYSKQYQ